MKYASGENYAEVPKPTQQKYHFNILNPQRQQKRGEKCIRHSPLTAVKTS